MDWRGWMADIMIMLVGVMNIISSRNSTVPKLLLMSGVFFVLLGTFFLVRDLLAL